MLLLQIIGIALLAFLVLTVLVYLLQPALLTLPYSLFISLFVRNPPYLEIKKAEVAQTWRSAANGSQLSTFIFLRASHVEMSLNLNESLICFNKKQAPTNCWSLLLNMTLWFGKTAVRQISDLSPVFAWCSCRRPPDSHPVGVQQSTHTFAESRKAGIGQNRDA